MLSHWLPAYFPLRDPVLIFAIVLVLFLGSPIVMGRLRLPGMIGLLLAGAILGPHALGVLDRDASFVLLGAVGLIYIMFTAALEVDLSAFRKHSVHTVIFGVLTFSIPQGLGTLMAHYVLGFDWLAAILLASMFASHTLLAYPIVGRLGLASNRAVTATVGGTMITDTAALLVLAVVAGMTTGEVNEAFWWRLGVSLVVFVAAVLFGLPALGRRFFVRFPKDGPGQFVFVLTSVFLCAVLANVAGLEPIVGAFLAGLALNRLIPHESPLMNRIVFTGDAIFIPFFLLSVGMLLDGRVLFGGLRTWAVALGMTITVTVTKYLAAGVARVLFRFRREEGRVMFGLSVVQAAATLAAVMVGNRIGLFDEAVVNGTIVMILVTCILGPAIVARFAPALALAAANEPGEARTSRGVLVPLLSGGQGPSVFELALLLRGDDKTAPLYPAFVTPEKGDVARAMGDADKVLAAAVSQANAADCVVEPLKRVHDEPGRALVLARKELGVPYVVVPWYGAPSDGPGPLGRTLDSLVGDLGVSTYLAQLPHPLGTCSRVILFLPPAATASLLFHQEVEQLAYLCKRLGAPLLALVAEADEKSAREALGGLPKLELRTYAGPSMWLTVTSDQVRSNDLLIFHGAREGEPGFTPDYQSFVVRAFSRLPDHDVIVLYRRTQEEAGLAPAPAPAARLAGAGA